MVEHPWLTIIGLGEDGPEGLPPASLAALKAAEIVMGPPRHLSLLGEGEWQVVEWPVPFSEGIDQLLSFRGQNVVVLASGDPFWFGAGTVLARHLRPEEWTAIPAVSCFSLSASRLGWPLDTTLCLGLHSVPITRLRPHLVKGNHLLVTLRDGRGPVGLASYLAEQGFGASVLHFLEALGGPNERISSVVASDLTEDDVFSHPLCAGIEVRGTGASLPKTVGVPDDWFEHDGQITKRPIRALTLSALAPRPREYLWDVGGGSGSISIEWLLSDPTLRATVIEADPDRAERIRKNAIRLGVDHLHVVTGTAPRALADLDRPDVVFVGGGVSEELLTMLTGLVSGTRLVVNAVTLEAEMLLTDAHNRLGGDLMRLDISRAAPLGSKRGWRTAYPIVQWSITL